MEEPPPEPGPTAVRGMHWTVFHRLVPRSMSTMGGEAIARKGMGEPKMWPLYNILFLLTYLWSPRSQPEEVDNRRTGDT